VSENLAVAYSPYTTLNTFPSTVQNRCPVVLYLPHFYKDIRFPV